MYFNSQAKDQNGKQLDSYTIAFNSSSSSSFLEL